MKLADLRRLAVRQGIRIWFTAANGVDCVVDERGVARVPSLKGTPAFNLEEELASAREFRLEQAESAGANRARERRVTLEELTATVSAAPKAAHAQHEEE